MKRGLIERVFLATLMVATTAATQPPAPAAAANDPAAEAVEAIARIRTATSPSLSPDGRQLAYISSESGIPQVWLMVLDGSTPPRQLTRLEDPVQTVRWSPAGDWLAYDVAPGGGLNVQIYVMQPDGSGSRRLTAGGQDNNSLVGWTDDGRLLQVSNNVRDAAAFDAYLLDPVSGQLRAVSTGPGRRFIGDVSDDGRFAVVGRLVSRGNNDLYLVDLQSGRETLLTPHDDASMFGWGEFSPDGRHIYVTYNGGRDRAAFGVIDLGAAVQPAPIRLLAERSSAEAEGAVLSDDGRRAVLVWNVAGRSELEWLDTATGRITRGPRLPFEVIGAADFSRDGRTLAVTGIGATRPTDIYTIDVRNGEVTQRTHSAHEGVDLSALVRPELITYRGHDGLELSGWLYRPRGAASRGPVVFDYHGGPEGQARPGLNPTVQALVARGISVFQPNVRGSSGFGKRFMALDNGPLRVDGVRDIESTTNSLIERGVADPARLGIMGGSYGGYMVMAGVTQYPNMFAAGANLFGIVNFATFFQNTQPWMAAISTIEYGDPSTQADMLHDLSPIHRLDRIKTPLMVLHGANDTNVPVIEAEQIVQNLRGRQIPVDYILFPDEGHGWRKLPNRVRSTVAIVNFFGQQLNGRR